MNKNKRKNPQKSRHRWCFIKKVFFKISQNSQENTYDTASYNKIAGFRAATLPKRDSYTGILR